MHLLLSNQKATKKVNMRVMDLLSRKGTSWYCLLCMEKLQTLKLWELVCLLQVRHVDRKTQNCPNEAAGEGGCGI